MREVVGLCSPLHHAATLGGVHQGCIRAYIQVSPAKAGCIFCGCWQQLTAVCPVAGTAWNILHARGVNWKNTLVVVVLSIAPCVRCGMGWRGIQPCLSHRDAGMAQYRAIRMQARHAMGHRDGGIAHQGWMTQPQRAWLGLGPAAGWMVP